MIEQLTDLPGDVTAVRATGKVTRADYEQVIEPLLDEARIRGDRVRFLFDFAPEFEGFTAGAVWEDTKVGLRHIRRFERCAVVTDVDWVRQATRIVGALLPVPVRVFARADFDEAVHWLCTPAAGSRLTHRLLPARSVLVLEPQGLLRPEDFDAVSATVDAWIEAHGPLRGIVVHARQLPGWENFASVAKHLRFVRDHHRRIERIAIAADGTLAELAPRSSRHFVAAAIEQFAYDDVERAIAWAAGE